MRDIFHRVILGALLLTGPCTWAQMHKVAKPEQVVRAIGVYEWTGDFAKPTASRLIPVSLFIDGRYEDAGIYIARPIPFALLTGNIYELQEAGVAKATLDLAYARHLQAVEATGDLAYDDGWFGYGSVKPLAAPRRSAALKPSKNLPVLNSSTKDTAHSSQDSKSTATSTTSDDPDRPTMKRRSADTSSSGNTPAATSSTTASTPADDPDRPTMKRRSDSTDTSATPTSTASTTTADDPDRPTMSRRSSDTSTDTTASTTTSGNTPSDDPDRPTLKRHSAEDAKKSRNNSDLSTVTSTGSLNDDPDRPNLHHGKPTSAMNETDLPKLVGLPQNLHQMIAVSDAVNRDTHPYALEWDDAAQHAAILQKMQIMARAQLAAYTSTPATPPAAAVKKTTPVRTHHAAAAAATPAPLLEEELKAYTLSYGGASTYVYTAQTAGVGASLRYVTIVAQDNGLGDLKPAIQSVTDASHLDRSPRMRFVGVVDVEASNRASLLFELRGQNSRQFGLYRVIASHADQIFLTGTTQ